MPVKVLIFAGAPESSTLNWDTGLLSDFSDPIAQFAGLTTDRQQQTSGLTEDQAVWRSLTLDKSHDNSSNQPKQGAFNPYYDEPAEFLPGTGPEFLTTVYTQSFTSTRNGESQSQSQSQDHALSQLYEHSIAIHQEMPSSHLVLDHSQSDQSASFISNETTSFMSDRTSQHEPARGPLPFRGDTHLADLKDIPPASHLTKLLPQTVSVNLIVGIISVARPRVVNTRWGPKYLVEILVGDETRAGFTITYWLPSYDIEKSCLAGLRPGDIVLMQNIGLNVFLKKVYGSSLRKDLSKVHLLYRVKLDSKDSGGHYAASDLSSTSNRHPQLDKTHQVRDWVLNFVGGGNRQQDKSKTKANPKRRWERPPDDDTQLMS
ncbi:hypothetical protein QBC40DRAFT_316881 [Triangularia verruculosa]|uniref:Uncharacterized protein n=1 Tax=Triangularia verruculosa TaxID=2587418 RepID=A0AAN6X771_9PEZI|nr:hypothetical protein QBC40DRAFT_316881 [Triangularia verruculosa]